jgi:hypothetical protein
MEGTLMTPGDLLWFEAVLRAIHLTDPTVPI